MTWIFRQLFAIAVLPFANLSPDAENEYFGDGLTEEIISDLSKVRALSVISRTSAMQLKGARKDARTIGRELAVQYVLDGSVRKAGNSLRITAQLIEAATDSPVWSDKYSGTMDDVFEVQERVSREIVKALDITLTSDEHLRLGERLISDPHAFELYLRARQELRRYAVDRAASLVREAMRIEGETPLLRALLGWSDVYRVRTGISPDRTPLDEAEHTARELLTQVPGAAYGHALLGHIGYERSQMPEAVHHFEVALDKEPNDGDAHLMMTISLICAGQNAEAQASAQRLMAADPLSPASWMATGVPWWFVGQPERVIPDLRRGLELDPHNFIINWCIGYAYALMGQTADTSRHAQILAGMGPESPYTRQLLSLIDGLEGRADAALARIASLDVAPLDAHHQFHLAESFIVAGAADRGLDLLEQSVQGFHAHLYLSEYCRFLDPVRDTARFRAYLATAKRNTEMFLQRKAALKG
jgi:non-specific serine/threonine protein kinase